MKTKEFNKLLELVKKGKSPAVVGVFFTREQADKLRPYADPAYYKHVIEARVPDSSITFSNHVCNCSLLKCLCCVRKFLSACFRQI